MRPFPGAEMCKDALEVNNRTKEEIETFPDWQTELLKFKEMMSKFVDKYRREDKFVAAGYNVGFDMDMLRASFERMGDKYFGSWFFWPVIDVKSEVAKSILRHGIRLENYQLKTVCKHFGIEIDAHDALSDIKATRNLFYLLEDLNRV